ncbi:CDP-alcohol phosphatidyltransferase family protein [Streptomyces sp. NPDC001380]|uniref:CDP-alcohol phosphatidyltransferase family protein n=1 Tax=Streptomyces sp. NPDC001380 TaxID=3364566 RepID=UPI0036ACD49C
MGLGPAGWLTGGVLAVAVPALLAGALRRSGASAPGPADRVTLARTVLGGGVAALVADGTGHGAVLTGLAAAALALDAVDGRVARRTGTASPLGARFDMEADAFLILVLSVRAAASCGAWVLAAGAMRYAFVAAARVAPWLRAALPPSLARKAVAAQQGVTLAVVCAGVLPPAASAAVAAAALAALVWSFGRDTVWLWRARPRGAVAAASGLTDAAARAGLPPAPAAPAGPARAGGAEVLPVAAGLPGLPGLAVAAAVAGPARPQDGPGRDRGARVAAGPVRLRQAGFPAEGQSSRCGR